MKRRRYLKGVVGSGIDNKICQQLLHPYLYSNNAHLISVVALFSVRKTYIKRAVGGYRYFTHHFLKIFPIKILSLCIYIPGYSII